MELIIGLDKLPGMWYNVCEVGTVAVEQEIQARMEQAIEQFNELMEELCPILEAMWEAISEIMRTIVREIKRIFEAVRRWWLYFTLTRWHIPHRVAKFIAERWPKYWLPDLTNFLECGTISLQ